MYVPVRPRRPRRAVSAALALGLTAGLVYGAAPQHPAATAVPRTAPAAASTRLSAARASAQARATGKAVVADALTTETDQTTANPDGSFTLTTSPTPVRVARGGAWVNLDATLVKNPDGSYSPAATPSRLVLSPGGAGPLAILTSGGRQLSVTLPISLPAPSVSGDIATYPNVLPDVDLVVTATAQGGYSDVFVVKTAAAAANPSLSTLMHAHVAGTGVSLSTDAAGNLTAATATGRPVFTAPAASMWDSATITPATANTTGHAAPGATAPVSPSATPTSATGSGTDPATGASLASTVNGPGEGAHRAALAAVYTDGTLTLTPSASLLSGAKIRYPLFIDPSVAPTVGPWTMVNNIYPTTSYYDAGTDGHMQVGYQGWSAPYFTARSFTTLNLSPVPAGAVVSSAQVNFFEDTAPSCTVMTEVDLYTTGAINSSTTWNNQPAWGAFIGGRTVELGYSGCSAGGVGWDITNQVKSALPSGSLTLGLRAADEGDKYGWKQFNGDLNTETHTNASVTYDLYPDTPTGLYTSPTTNCATTALGDTAVSLYAPVSTRTGANLTTTFSLYKTTDAAKTNLLTPTNGVAATTYAGPSGQPAVMALPETFFKTLAAGNATSFSWQAQTTDGTLTSSWSSTCTFTWDPTRPGAPGVTPTTSPATGNTCPLVPATPAYPVGTLCSFTLTPPNNTTISGYLYQLNQAPPTTLAATGTATIALTLPRIVNTLTVSALSAGGNVGSDTVVTVDATAITPPAKDSDLTNDGTPDLIIPGNTPSASNTPPGLWLASGNPDGSVNAAAANIGVSGLGFSSPPTATDWNGTQTITGDYCGLGAQDVLAYVPGATTAANPNGGGGAVVCGDGSSAPLHQLNPVTGTAYTINAQTFQDSGANATEIAGGGTQTFTDVPTPVDLFYGTITTSTGASQLDAFGMAAGSFGQAAPIDLATQLTPTGGTDWNNWTITTAQLASGTAMYLWNSSTGDLYLWTGVTLNNTTFGNVTGIATPTQYKIASGWHTGASHLLLRAADINNDGIPDLWAVNTTPGSTLSATAYLVTNLSTTTTATVTATASQNLTTTAHDWMLDDDTTGTATSAADTNTTLPLAGSGGATWHTGDTFSPDLALDGTNGHLATTTGAVDLTASFTISAWVKPATLGGTVLSQDGTNDSGLTLSATTAGWQFALNTGAGTSASFDTVTGGAVQLDVWTHITAAYDNTAHTMSLYVNDVYAASTPHTAPATAATGPFQIGADLIAGTRGGYLTGQVSQVQVWTATALPPGTWGTATAAAATPATGPDLYAANHTVALYQIETDGNMWGTSQSTPGGSFSSWLKLSTSGALTGTPSAIQMPNGLVALYARTTTGQVQGTTQSTVGGPFGPYITIGGTGVTLAADPTLILLTNGELALYAVGTDGNLWQSTQTSVYGSWAPWTRISTGANLTARPALVQMPNGLINVYALTTTGQVQTAYLTPAGNVVSPLTPITATGATPTGDIRIVPLTGTRLALYAVGTDGNLYGANQASAYGPFTPYTQLSTTGTFTGQPAAIQVPDGQMGLYAHTTANQIQGTSQTTPGATPSPYIIIGDTTTTLTGNPTLLLTANATLAMYAPGTTNTIYGTDQNTPHGPWTTWALM